jgi:hypothetical protein
VTFEMVTAAARQFPDLECVVRYDGAPVLKVHGTFVAAVATHPSAEPGTLVVRMTEDDRASVLDDAPGTYYLTDYYRRYPLILARLSALTEDAVRDLLAGSRTLALLKVRPRADHHSRTTAR